LRVTFLWLVGYAFFVFHGLSFHLTPWSQAFINTIVKYTYGETGQQDTTVVLFREENLRALGTQYPVPYEVHAVVLEALAAYRPRAVFVDFAFIDQRPEDSVEGLARSICALQSVASDGLGESVRVFLAAPKGEKVREELLGKCARRASPDMDEGVGDSDSGVLTYSNGSGAGKEFIPSAAYALAASKAPMDATKEAPLEIIWGKGIAPLNLKWMKCDEPSLLESIWATLTRGPLATKLTCPYTRTISVAHLLNHEGNDPDVRDALENRTVLYGASFRLTGDRVDSPVYAELPGVYLHAMAYDNLVTFGRDYKRADRRGVKVRLLDSALLLLSAMLLVSDRFARERAQPASTLVQFERNLHKGAIGIAGVALLFIWISWARGLDDGLVALFALYLLYRWLVVKDTGFVVLALITLGSALFAYYYVNLGPRNILAFLVFFEVVRQVQQYLKKYADHYFNLKSEEGMNHPPRYPVWRLADWFFGLYRTEVEPAAKGKKETAHESRNTHVAT
jgi:CHASE2 domain-containing sensor protein